MKLQFETNLRYVARSGGLNLDSVMATIAARVIERIRKRTLSGLNANLKPFPPGVDLVDSGKMLASLRVAASSADGFELTVGVPYAAELHKKYNWFALSKKDEKFIVDSLGNAIMDSVVEQ